MTIAYRIADALDMPFVISGWSTSYRVSHSAGIIGTDDWAAVMRPVISKLLARPSTTTLVAYDPGETDRVADLDGFVSFSVQGRVPVVYYCYVRQTRRRSGIGMGLFKKTRINPDRPWEYACKTPVVSHLGEHLKFAKWNPHRARFVDNNVVVEEKRHG